MRKMSRTLMTRMRMKGQKKCQIKKGEWRLSHPAWASEAGFEETSTSTRMLWVRVLYDGAPRGFGGPGS